MKKVIYFLLLVLFVLFSWLHKDQGSDDTSRQEKSYQIVKIN